MMPKTLPTVAVVTHVHAGHVPAYRRLYGKKFSAHGCRVLDIGPEQDSTLLARATRRLSRWGWLHGRRVWRNAAKQVRVAERAAGVRADAVFLVYLGSGLLEAAISPADVERWFPWPWSGVHNGPAAVRGAAGNFPGRERALAAANCRSVVVTDDAFVEPCRASWPGRRVIAMPEIAELSPPGRATPLDEWKRATPGRPVVGLLGVINGKKNIEAFLALAAARPDASFVIAGDFSPDACAGAERARLTAAFAAATENVRLFPEPITDGPDFNAWLAACDVVWLAYRDFAYNSNVLTKAAHFRKPVIVGAGGVMAAHVARHNLGEIAGTAEVRHTAAALDRLLRDTGAARDFAGYAERNSAARLDQTVAEILASFAPA